MAVYAIDPSTNRIGWAVLEKCGSLRSSGAVEPTEERDPDQWCWRITSMLDQLPTFEDVSVLVVERPPLMRRKQQDRIINAAGRCYEWGRLVLKPREVVFVQPTEWMQRRGDGTRKCVTKPQRAARVAA